MTNHKSVTLTSHTSDFRASVTQLSHTSSKKCSECRNPLPLESKASTQTCSAKCRKQRERRQKLQHAAWVGAVNELNQIRDALKRGEDVIHHRDCLIRLKDEINELLIMANDQDAIQRREMFEARARIRRW